MNHLCHGYVTDDQFLEHMIPHHQMAIDMAQQVLKYTKNPAILAMAREIIWTQQNEIWVMKALLRSPSFCTQLANKDNKPCIYNNQILNYYYPSHSEDFSTKGQCDMKFMKPCNNILFINNYNKYNENPNFWKGLSLNPYK